MEVAKARLDGTVEEWQQLTPSEAHFAFIHKAAELLASELIQLLIGNKLVKTYVADGANRLSLSLSLSLQERASGKETELVRVN